MNAQHNTKTVDELLQLRRANMLYPNPEYQRSAVWTPGQKKRLLDSVLRGYPIPLIYLHHISKEVAGARREDFEIIDGQQRINALYEYVEGAYKLFDPLSDEEAGFPSFIQEQACPWGAKSFDQLTPELQQQLRGTSLSIVFIETHVVNEARDLFIRLQAGMPLNSQEKRDAWPGEFTEYILRLAGKPEIARYPGHDFFKVVLKAKDRNRGEFRQLAAQMVMLYLTRKRTRHLCDTNRDAIDTFYHKNLSFDNNVIEVRRIIAILDLLTELLKDGKRKRPIGHEAIGLLLLVDSLLDDYTASWRPNFAKAFDEFRIRLAQATSKRVDEPGEYWLKYGQLARTNSDRADSIERRQMFFAEKMYEQLNLQLKDPDRGFGELERELIYYRDKKRCQAPRCGTEVAWSEAEFHHITEHHQGGQTTVENGALVHKGCHPKSQKAVLEFAEHWLTKGSSSSSQIASSTTLQLIEDEGEEIDNNV
jgi:Protein of unknown function DUF262/HNH endonuclease